MCFNFNICLRVRLLLPDHEEDGQEGEDDEEGGEEEDDDLYVLPSFSSLFLFLFLFL